MKRELAIPATDGRPIEATLYGEPESARSLVTLNPATAVPRRFYREFAEFLASRGHLALAFDYRYARDARMREWGEKDLAGVLAWAQKEHGALPLVGVGHSAGGQMLALADGADRYRAFVGIAAQSGYWRHWPAPLRWRRALDWHVLLPAFAHAFGRIPGGLGVGDGLPKGVALEWARWSRHPDYILSEEGDLRRARLARLAFPLLAYSFADDAYAPKPAADWLAAQLTAATVERRHVTPREIGARTIGHFGFFRRGQGGPLWEPTAAWIEARLAPTSRGT